MAGKVKTGKSKKSVVDTSTQPGAIAPAPVVVKVSVAKKKIRPEAVPAKSAALKKTPPPRKPKALIEHAAPGATPKSGSRTKTLGKTARLKPDSAKAESLAADVVRILGRLYPDAVCSLDFQTPLELLMATILSAQCTDERVNIVTKNLFRKYRSAADYAHAAIGELEKDIQSTGFFRNKAKNIQNCCRLLIKQYEGQVPNAIEPLVALPGIGRKTASVVLGTAFGIASGVVVDTHVGRISQRLGLTNQKDAEKIERDLMEAIPKEEWIAFSHRMIQFGRKVCTSRKPQCGTCPMGEICPRIGVQDE
jgi:endonuclease III